MWHWNIHGPGLFVCMNSAMRVESALDIIEVEASYVKADYDHVLVGYAAALDDVTPYWVVKVEGIATCAADDLECMLLPRKSRCSSANKIDK